MSTRLLPCVVVIAIIALFAVRSPAGTAAAEDKPAGAPAALDVKWSPMAIRSERQVALGLKGGEGGQCLHGIERSWNQQGLLHRGYPRYWLNDARVTKSQYVRACADDPALPPFHERDNRPQRRFPSEVIVR